MDFLGLRNLTVLEDALQNIRANGLPVPNLDELDLDADQNAYQLLGQGDMLYMAGGGRISRVHGPFVSDGEVEKIVSHLKMQGVPEYLDAITADEEIRGPFLVARSLFAATDLQAAIDTFGCLTVF